MIYWPLQQPFQIVRGHGFAWLACKAFTGLNWVVHGFSLRMGGLSGAPAEGMNLGFSPTNSPALIEENRRRFLRALGANGFSLAELQQMHSILSYRVRRAGAGLLEFSPTGPSQPAARRARRPEGDVLLTNHAGILLAIRTADCLPVLLADRDRRAVAAVHAGWRGTLESVVERAVGEMTRAFGSRPRSLVAALGPSIRSCCYEVGPEVVEAFRSRFRESEHFFRHPNPAGRARLDLAVAAIDQLRRAGIRPSAIHLSHFCTACRTDWFFSHRKEGARTGRMMAVIGIRFP